MVDCYQDGAQAAPNFLRYLPMQTTVIRTAYDAIPTNIGAFAGMVISGSSASVNEPPPWLGPLGSLVSQAITRKVPVLGVCFGHQLLAHIVLGPGSVQLAPQPEVGFLDIEVTACDPLFHKIPPQFKTFLSHSDQVVGTGPEITVLARSVRCTNQAFRVGALPIWGVQFHSEMDPAENQEILEGRAIRHPVLQLDPVLEMSRLVDSAPIATQLFGNFVDHVQNQRVE